VRVRPTVYLVGEFTPRMAGYDPGTHHGGVAIDARFCPHCGHQMVIVNRCHACNKDLPVEAKFCMVCGAKVEKPHLTCPKCRGEILPEATFCNHCGEKVR